MTQTTVYILIVINVITFLIYGIGKWRSTSGRLLPTGRKKAKQGSWRISEATLLMLAVIGGTIGALLDSIYANAQGKSWQLLTPRIGEQVRLNEQQTFSKWW